MDQSPVGRAPHSLLASGRIALPSWLAQERDELVQVHDAILKCVCFLGTPTERGFSVEGTGFFVGIEQDDFMFQYLVTARHVVWPIRNRRDSEPPDTKIYVRINTKSGRPSVEATNAREWLYADKGIDLCVLAVPYAAEGGSNDQDSATISLEGMALTDERALQSGIGIGEEVFIGGAFVHHIGEHRNIPIVRIGNIAAMPSEPISFSSPRKAAFLVETRSLGGISGSPVFLNMQSRWGASPGTTIQPREVAHERGGKIEQRVIFPYWLIGMVLGTHSGAYMTDVSSADDIISANDVDLNSGISVVMRVNEIRDFLESEPVKAHRTKEIEALEKKSGYRPTSAPRIAKRIDRNVSQAIPEPTNPSHKEDFMSLLGAAAKTKPQAD